MGGGTFMLALKRPSKLEFKIIVVRVEIMNCVLGNPL